MDARTRKLFAKYDIPTLKYVRVYLFFPENWLSSFYSFDNFVEAGIFKETIT